jgi:hypothetical protein
MPTNTLLTISQITREALRLFLNSNAFLQTIDKQYDPQFARTGGGKIGATLRIRLPNDYTVRSGASAASPQDTTERNTTLTVATQKGVDVSFSSADLSLSLSDFGTRILRPMMNSLAGAVATDVMSLVEGVPNIVHAVDGSNNTISPTATTWLQAGAVLDQLSAPRGERCAILDVLTQSRTVAGFTGLFNPTNDTSDRWRTGLMGTRALGIDDWRMDQTAILHTTAAYSTLNTVTSVSADGLTLTTAALAGPLTKGDIVTIAGVNSVNRVTKADNGVLAQFVVTANAATSATSVSIYPPLIPPSGGNPVQYQTVSKAISGSPALASPIKASEVYRKNFVFLKEAFTLATADLDLPTGAVVDCSRQVYDGVSIRIIRDYITTTDQWLTRSDILYGYASPRAEWCVIVADST